jgi:hypothetical protein
MTRKKRRKKSKPSIKHVKGHSLGTLSHVILDGIRGSRFFLSAAHCISAGDDDGLIQFSMRRARRDRVHGFSLLFQGIEQAETGVGIRGGI